MFAASPRSLVWTLVATGSLAALWFARFAHAGAELPTSSGFAHKLTLQEVKSICAAAPLPDRTESAPVCLLNIAGSAALEEQVELSQLASGHQLDLTPEQLKVFASITNTIQAARRRYEASIAKMLPPRDAHLELIVPMYSQVGDDLRSLYYQQLALQLGSAVTERIQKNLGAELETLFADFGAAEQGLDVAVEQKPSGTEYTVSSTAVFFASSAAAEPYAIHRETHLLPMEDPTGATWADFVRRFASQS